MLQGVTKTYRQGAEQVKALQDVNLEIADGEFVAVTGKSGCGKSTLLHVIGGLEGVSAGSIFFRGQDLSRFQEDQLTKYRRDQVGIVFQSFNLMPLLTHCRKRGGPPDFEGDAVPRGPAVGRGTAGPG